MLFFELYEYVEADGLSVVSFDYLRKKIDAYHSTIGRVDVFSISYPKPNSQAHYKLGIDRTSAYDEQFIVAEIYYCQNLNGDLHSKRYALTKELMHVFDSEEEQVNTKDKFTTLISDIQNQPIFDHASPMYKSEINTRWMATLILCPKSQRDKYFDDYNNRRCEDVELAQVFRVPEWVIPLVMSNYYDMAYETFVTTPKDNYSEIAAQ